MKINQLRQIIKEAIDEMAIDEMARTAGTGAKVKITDAGVAVLKKIAKTNEWPEGMTNKRFLVLKTLYQMNTMETPVQLTAVATKLDTTQQGVNSEFKYLKDNGYAEATAYTPKGPSTPKNPRQSKEDLLSGLDFIDEGLLPMFDDEGQKSAFINGYNFGYRDAEEGKPNRGNIEDWEF
jgi:hypothetical protein